MIRPEVLDALLAAGCSAEQIVAAVKADAAADEARKADKRANNAERQRRFKAKRRGEITPDNADNALPDVTPLEVSPHTPLPNPPVSSPPISPRKKRGAPAPTVAPDWVPAEPWAAFDEMRQSMKHKWPWSEKAAKGIWDDLEGFRAAGHDIGAILMNSVKKGYRGVFAPDKPALTPASSAPAKPMTYEGHMKMVQFFMERDLPLKADYHRREAAKLRPPPSSGPIGRHTPEVRATH